MYSPSNSSGLQTGDAAIMNKPGLLHGYSLISNGTDAATLVIYDNASAASGTAIGKATLPASAVGSKDVIFSSPIVCNNGIYADVTTANYIIYFSVGL
jgi:hypothetical protein